MVFASLLDWFQKNQREFPWRQERTPYKTWISEVMLQQTRASVVIPYFIRWMNLFPNVDALARAPLDLVIKAWEGLGYYSRARHLHEGAKLVMKRFGGEIPSSREALESIPGLGPYTVGAILSFGFRQRAVAVDGNVARVLARYFAIEENIGKVEARRTIEEKMASILDEKQPWMSVEALIELGAVVCRQKPLCSDCPLQADCLGLKKGIHEFLPIKSAALPITHLARAVGVLECQDLVLLRRVEKGKIMADLFEFPFFEKGENGFCTSVEMEKWIFCTLGLTASHIRPLRETVHSFTRYKVRLFPYLVQIRDCLPVLEWTWRPKKQLAQLPFCAGHKNIVRQIL